MSRSRGNPFSPRVALGLILAGALIFVGLLWAIGSGMADPEPQPSGAHVEGKGLTGFAALSAYLKARGFGVSQTRSQSPLNQGGLLVLTPLHQTKAEALNRAINSHRQYGPVLLIMPKWLAMPFPPNASEIDPKIKQGFVQLVLPRPPEWKGFHDEISVDLSPLPDSPDNQTWFGMDQTGTVVNPQAVVSARGKTLAPLVSAGKGGRTLAAFFTDSSTAELAVKELAPSAESPDEMQQSAPDQDADAPSSESDQEPEDEPLGAPDAPVETAPTVNVPANAHLYPVIVVFDPDLLNNYGFAHRENALLGESLVRAALDGQNKQVVFDLSLAGYGRSENLLDLAFTPPFLAATLCLLLAAAVALWRAYHRFGPPLLAGRSIAFGKRALIGNAAGLVRRAKRLHLLGGPYADAARERLVRALALPPRLDPAAAEAAIDRALHARTGSVDAFSTASAALREARRPRDMLRAAQALNSLERTLLQ